MAVSEYEFERDDDVESRMESAMEALADDEARGHEWGCRFSPTFGMPCICGPLIAAYDRGWNDSLKAFTKAQRMNEPHQAECAVYDDESCDCGKDAWDRKVDSLRRPDGSEGEPF